MVDDLTKLLHKHSILFVMSSIHPCVSVGEREKMPYKMDVAPKVCVDWDRMEISER